MKSLKEFINEKETDKYGREILTKDEINLDVIENAIYAASFTKDRATIITDFGEYNKIKKNQWQYSPRLASAFGGTYSDKQMLDIVKKAKDVKMYLQ